jgi:hypothetical protein
MNGRRRLAVLIAAAFSVCLLAAGFGTESAGANFGMSVAAGPNAFTAGIWVYSLHNNPTPPTANTTAQVNLTMNAAPATAATLFRYSTDCAARNGRRLTRAAPSPNQATVCNYVNWRTAALATPLLLSGTVTADIWSATDTGTANRTGGIVAYLRDYNGATYVEIANGIYSRTYAAGRTFYHLPITITLGAPYTLAAGHRLELKLVASNAYQSNMLVAYDTTTYSSVLRIR